MYERWTDRARKSMQLANQEAQRLNHEYVGTEHILLGIIREGSGVAMNALKSLGVDQDRLAVKLKDILTPGPDVPTFGKLPLTPRARKITGELCGEEAAKLSHGFIGTEHILLALMRERECIASRAIYHFGISEDDVRREIAGTYRQTPITNADYASLFQSGCISMNEARRRVAFETDTVCPDCKGTGKYQPLVGPEEPCKTCGGSR